MDIVVGAFKVVLNAFPTTTPQFPLLPRILQTQYEVLLLKHTVTNMAAAHKLMHKQLPFFF